MKKKVSILIALLFCAAAGVGCRMEEDHECVFKPVRSDQTHHWVECACGKSDVNAHLGGSSTLTERAKCTVCDQDYGETLAGKYAPEDTVYNVGDRVYDCTFTDTEGASFTLSEIAKEKLIVFNFWATWCPGCTEEFPALNEAYLAYKDRVEVLAISVEATDTTQKVAEFKEDNGHAFPMISSGDTGVTIQYLFPFRALPTTVIVDRRGIVVYQHSGSLTVEGFIEIFEKYLKI